MPRQIYESRSRMSSNTVAGLLITVILTMSLAIYTGLRGNRTQKQDGNGSMVIAGAIMGTLVGGSSTIGTAQLAYNWGFSAWWFTLGGGIACLILALLYTPVLRAQKVHTLTEIIELKYGRASGLFSSVLSAIGTLLNIVSQLIAAASIAAIVFPDVGLLVHVTISALFMALYVFSGGIKGAGIVGVLKLALLYIAMVTCGLLVLLKVNGLNGILSMVTKPGFETDINYFSLVSRGIGTDAGAGISMVLGVLTTQTYAQAVISGKTERDAKIGGIISACAIPLIGVCGILVGLYMRSVTDATVFDPKMALPSFIVNELPPVFGGVVLGTLFIASVGTGAGLTLGIATTIDENIIRRLGHNKEKRSHEKPLIIVIILLGVLLSNGVLGDVILSLGFMSMGLRGTVLFIPLCCALWLHEDIPRNFVLVSIILSPCITFIFGFFLEDVLPFDSLFTGIFASLIIILMGVVFGKIRCSKKSSLVNDTSRRGNKEQKY